MVGGGLGASQLMSLINYLSGLMYTYCATMCYGLSGVFRYNTASSGCYIVLQANGGQKSVVCFSGCCSQTGIERSRQGMGTEGCVNLQHFRKWLDRNGNSSQKVLMWVHFVIRVTTDHPDKHQICKATLAANRIYVMYELSSRSALFANTNKHVRLEKITKRSVN